MKKRHNQVRSGFQNLNIKTSIMEMSTLKVSCSVIITDRFIMKIVMISDTHNRHEALNGKIPECDLLIHAGDMTGKGENHAVKACYKWLSQQPARHIVTIPGNHELYMERCLPRYLEELESEFPAIHVLINEPVEIEGIKIWGSPVTPWFYDWAWNVHRGPDIRKYWEAIPEDVQILITHGPPYGILDIVPYMDGTPKERVGCHDLEEIVRTRLKNLKLHVFGHVHHSSGVMMRDGVTFVNASICDEQYSPSNPPRTIDFGDEFK